jgi:AcrR family transcriptional regulator
MPDVPPRRRLGEDERRSQIIAAAARVLSQEGFDRTTLSRVAAEAGVSKGLVPHHFGSRDDLMVAVVETLLPRLREATAAGVDLAVPVPDVLRSFVSATARLHLTHRTELDAVEQVVRNLRDTAGRPVFTLDLYESIYQSQEELFRRGQDEGSLRRFDPRVMAVTYQGAVDVMLAYLAARPDVDPEAYAAELADLVVAAVVA